MKKSIFLLCLLLCLPFFVFGCEAEDCQINEYKISASFDDENMSLSCKQSSTFVNKSENALDLLEMFLYANSFEKTWQNASVSNFNRAYYNGESYGNINISKVESDKKECQFELSEKHNILRIFLPKKLYPDEKFSFEMEYIVSLANVNHRLGYGEKTINFGSVFPMFCVYKDGFFESEFVANGDPFFSDVSNFSVGLNYPQKYVLASSGQISKIEEGKALIVGEKIRDFCAVLSENFELISDEIDGIKVNYYFYEDENAAKHLETARRAIKFFSDRFGKYPYSQISVVKTNFCFGGMEYPNLVMISDDLADEQTYNYVIVHELAHQWWYGLVGSNQFEEPWVDESLTEYSSALFFEEYDEYGLEYDTIVENAVQSYKQFVEVYTHVLKDVDQSMGRSLKEFSTEPEYVNCIYTKGVIFYDSLRDLIGKKNMYKSLKNYCKKYAYKNASSADIIDCFSSSTNRNLSGFFMSWLDGNVVIK